MHADVFRTFLLIRIVMSLSIKGKLIKILPVESGVARSGNPWKKQEFVIETQDQFPRKVCFTLFNDKVSLLNGINAGDDLEVSFDIESREFNNKWYHNINAWKVEKTGKGAGDDFPPPEAPAGDPGDLPF